MALSKEKKKRLVNQYIEWMNNSQAMVITEYTGLSVKDLDTLREQMRDVGGEFHIIKNTLAKHALSDENYKFDEETFLGSTAIGFAFEDPPALAKVIADFTKQSDHMKIKGGYLATEMISAEQIKALADLPPLPVMRATLLSTILAPASQLVRTLSEPGRQIAAVLQAYGNTDAAVEVA